MSEPLIVAAIRRYLPDWQAPKDTGKEWLSCHCAFHGDGTRSAAVSYQHNKYRCFGCEVRGDAIDIIRSQEGVDYPTAKRIAESISSGSDNPVPRQPDRKPRRRLSAEPWAVPGERAGSEVPTGIRGRSSPWS